MSPKQVERVQKTWRKTDQGRNLTAMISVAVRWLVRPQNIVIAVQQLMQEAAYASA